MSTQRRYTQGEGLKGAKSHHFNSIQPSLTSRDGLREVMWSGAKDERANARVGYYSAAASLAG